MEINAATCNPLNAWNEYDFAAEWCAKRGLTGGVGCELPRNLSAEALELINEDTDAFEQRVKVTAYAIAMKDTPEE